MSNTNFDRHRRVFSIKRSEPMRVSDRILRCVGAVVRISHDEPERSDCLPVGTGFFLRIKAGPMASIPHCYFITAKHILEDNGRYGIRVNRMSGGSDIIEVGRWTFHKESNVDVAITKITVNPDHDIIFETPKTLLVRQELDDIYFPGPADKIIEVLNSPTLVDERNRIDKEVEAEHYPTLDSKAQR